MEEKMSGIREQVRENGGVMTTTMEVLRDEYGAGRLGKHVREGIQKSLGSAGLRHLPDPLPEYQERPVRLYLIGSTVGDLIEAALAPSVENDKALIDKAGGNAEEILRQVRELVCGD